MKKYKTIITLLIVAFLTLFISGKTVEAKIDPNGPYCYYASDQLKIKIHEDDLRNAYVDMVGLELRGTEHYEIINAEGNGYCWIGTWSCSFMGFGTSITDTEEENAPKWEHKNGCPQYVFALKGKGSTVKEKIYIYATDSETDANQIIHNCQKFDADTGWRIIKAVGSVWDTFTCKSFMAKSTDIVSKEEYEESLKFDFSNQINMTVDTKTEGDCNILGKVNDSGWSTINTLTGDTIEHQPSLAYVIHKALQIMRVIAIALLIVLGMLDFAKAVFAGNEDEMKKNQKKFVKRLIIGVVIFLIPTMIDIIMKIASRYIDIKVCTDVLKDL